MKAMGWAAGALGVLALAGCSSSGGGGGIALPGGPGPIGPDPIAFSATTSGVAGTATVLNLDGDLDIDGQAPVAATVNVNGDGVTMAFQGGGLKDRTFTFQVEDVDARPITAVAVDADLGETADLTVLFDPDKASFAGLVIVSDADFDDENPGGKAQFHAFYGGNPNGEAFSAPAGDPTLTYKGDFVGVGTASADDLRGNVDITANFSNREVNGTISGLGAAGDVGFAAMMATDKATYSGDATGMTIGGTAADSGFVEGGFFGAGAAETAGAIFAKEGDNVVIGGYRADVTP